jgi:Clostridium P-47 protein
MTSATLPEQSMFRTFQVPKLQDIEPKIFVKRTDLPQGVLAAEANTMGWDTVDAIRLPVVNASLSKNELYPKTFDETLQAGWNANGKFGPWQMVPGGSGAIVFMKMPITEGHMTFTGQPNLDFANGSVTVQIKLKYLPQPRGQEIMPTTEKENGTPQYLQSDDMARSVDDPAVVIQNVDYGSVTPNDVQDALFKAAIAKWFNNNLDKFTYIFTTVNINALAAKEQFQWLKPTYTSYAYFNGADDESSYFGVLNMTSNDSPEGLTNQLPPSAIPSGCNASLLVSNEKFLRNMVLPGLPKAFPNATQSNFKITGNGTLIEKTDDNIKMDVIRHAGLNYTPYLEKFTLQIIGDEIQINNKIHVNVSPGIDVYFIGTYYYRLELVPKPGGGQTINWKESRKPETTHYNEIALGIEVTVIILGIISGIVAGIIGAIYKTLVVAVALIVIGIVIGLLLATPFILAKVIEGKAAEVLPDIGDLVKDAVGNVQWPDSSPFSPKSVQLNGSFVLGGNLS